jgi:cobalt-zinc-cadmium efflux system membrane fusion protein
MKLIRIVGVVSVLLLLVMAGCGRSEKADENNKGEANPLVEITKKQFESEGMMIGEATMQHFKEEVKCNGYVVAPANGLAQISAPLAGIVQTINCSNGEYVKKGQTLCLLSGNELMLIQQDFAETSAKLKRSKSDYDRSKALFDEKIGAERDFIATETEYNVMKSKYLALKLRLELLKLNVSKIEAGEFYAAYTVVSPISGYVTSLNMVLGQYTEQAKSLMEIVDVDQLQLQLSVFETDVNKLEPGQTVRFHTVGEPESVNDATILSVGKTINPESRTIQCIAKIINESGKRYINRSYMEAAIMVGDKVTTALPSGAVIKSGKDHFVFIVEKQDDQRYYLRREKVAIGRVSGDFTEIVGVTNLPKVLIRGAYNLPIDL